MGVILSNKINSKINEIRKVFISAKCEVESGKVESAKRRDELHSSLWKEKK